MKSEIVRNGWILVRRMRSKKTGNKWTNLRKPGLSRESNGLGKESVANFPLVTSWPWDLGKSTSSLWDSKFTFKVSNKMFAK